MNKKVHEHEKNYEEEYFIQCFKSFYSAIFKIKFKLNLFHIHGYIIVKKTKPKYFISEKCEKLKTFMKNE